jgi:hypothetical protein
MSEEMNERRRQYDTGTELLQNNEDDVGLRDYVEACRHDGQEYTKSTGDEYYEEQTDAQWDVVIAVCRVTAYFLAATDTVSTTC